ncbi:MAG: hypothetical protein IT437_05565 [Phycisphaerales bacterium]|nr:hypothetical protein [Phycisphaerales bacterium]
MRTTLLAVISLVLNLNALAQPLGTPPQERNAALRYWAAWQRMDGATREKVAAVPWKEMGDASRRQDLPRAFLDAAAAVPPVLVDQLIAASALARCDFEIEYEQGPLAQVPHLGPARTAARVLRIAARAKLADGDADAAAARIAAIYGMARHLAADHIHVSCFLAAGMAADAGAEVSALAASGRLTPAARASLTAALDRFDAADPFGMKAAFAGARAMTVGWVKANYTGEGAGDRFVRAWPPLGVKIDNFAAAFKGRDGTEMAALADRLSQFYDAVEAAWDLPEDRSVAELGRLSGINGKLPYGALALFMGSAPVKDKQADLDGRAALRGAREALAAVK